MEITNLDRDTLLRKWGHVIEQTRHIFTWTSGHELAWLAEMASRAKFICEIGSYHGKSALVMSLANPRAQILCIDNCENPEVESTFKANLGAQIKKGRVIFVRGTSEWLKGVHNKFDFCFIDGGHLEADVSTDITNLRPHMLQDSVMCGHDWRGNNPFDGVNQAVVKAFRDPIVFESIWSVKL